MLCLVCWYALTRPPRADHSHAASCWWSMGLVLHKSPAHVGLLCVPFLDHSYLHHLKGLVIGSGQAPKARRSPVILFLSLSPLPSPYCAWHHALPDPTELLPFPFLVGSLLFSFLPLYSLQGGSGSLLLFFVSCQLESHITQCKLGGRDYSSPGWPGGWPPSR